MRTFALCAICGVLAFVAVQYQKTGHLWGSDEDVGPSPPPPPLKLKFPEALAVLCRGTAVPQAAAFNRTADTHPTVIFRPNGTLHPWHERLLPGWQAESVEETELVLILPPQHRKLLQIATYANGAPSIRRYQYDLEARVLEARTGKPLAHKHFQTIARPVRPVETWALTELGEPVACRDVFRWLEGLGGHSAQQKEPITPPAGQ
jgi:hypothetical protein